MILIEYGLSVWLLLTANIRKPTDGREFIHLNLANLGLNICEEGEI